MDKIRVGAVSYLNTKPFLWGLQKSGIMDQIELTIDYPSNIAKGLQVGKLDMGLVPVAVIPLLKEYYFVGDYGIACDGEVASVALFSDVPVHAIERVFLDYQSRTSVALLRILLKQYWNVEPELIDANDDFEGQIQGSAAGLVIGDRALELRNKKPFVYDLGAAWKAMTGLPFVFAAWVSVRPLSAKFISEFSKACALGLEQIEYVEKENPFASYNLHDYYTRNIYYELDEKKKMGMQKFLELLPAQM